MFRLALALGRTVEELLETLSARELAEWADFYALEPWGSDARFLGSGIVAATIANANRDSKRKQEPFTPMDFMPDFGGERKRAKAKQKAKSFRESLKAHFGERIKHRATKSNDNRSAGSPTEIPENNSQDGDGGQRQSTDRGSGTGSGGS